MNISSIISEYNPLHNGHLYHIEKTKKETHCDGLIILISGNFVQRGEASIVNKWYRTHSALKAGADLVIELPCIYALNSAEFFSFGAISLLDSLKVVDTVSFGTELGSLSLLKKIATTLNKEKDSFKEALKLNISQGFSYPLSRNLALNSILDIENLDNILKSSNNILAIEYLKALLKINSTISPFTIKRLGADYNSNDLSLKFSSATGIRDAIKNNEIMDLAKFMPDYSKDTLKNSLTFNDDIFPYIKYKSLLSPDSLVSIPDCTEGLENKIIKEISSCSSFETCVSNIKSKRYAKTRIQRILTQFFIGFEKFDTANMRHSPPTYARILGFNDTGKEILRNIKHTSALDIITKIPKNYHNEMLKLDIQSTKMYSLINNNTRYNEDFLSSPVIIKK